MHFTRSMDHKLIQSAKKGDKRAFGLLVVRYQLKVAQLISRYVRDHSEVMDLAQETFIKAYRALPNFREDSSFYTWLYRIAVNTCKNYILSKERRVPDTDIDIEQIEFQESRMPVSEQDTPETIAMSEEVEEVVVGSINALPEELRTAILLREIEGRTYEDIAETMHCPVGTVRSRIYRAREAIEHSLGDIKMWH